MSFLILRDSNAVTTPYNTHTDNPKIFAGGKLPKELRQTGLIFSWKEWLPQASHKLSCADGGLHTLTYGKATSYLRIGYVSGNANALEISVTSSDYEDFLSLVDVVVEYIGGKNIQISIPPELSLVKGFMNDMSRLKNVFLKYIRSLHRPTIRKTC